MTRAEFNEVYNEGWDASELARGNECPYSDEHRRIAWTTGFENSQATEKARRLMKGEGK